LNKKKFYYLVLGNGEKNGERMDKVKDEKNKVKT